MICKPTSGRFYGILRVRNISLFFKCHPSKKEKVLTVVETRFRCRTALNKPEKCLCSWQQNSIIFLNKKRLCVIKLFSAGVVGFMVYMLFFSIVGCGRYTWNTVSIIIFFFLMLFQSTSSSSHFTSGCYGESERTQGAYSRLHNQQRDSDSKRPKLSCTPTSSVRNNGLTAFSGERLITRAELHESFLSKINQVLLSWKQLALKYYVSVILQYEKLWQ